ncbi:MAG: iron ABC transporter permease [Burkholderiales bacterium]|nr:iron ABC transporter permease [Burkholderiales bacterium]
MTKPLPATLLALTALLLMVAIAFVVGRFAVSPGELLTILWAKLTGGPHTLPATMETVVMQIRGPRIFAAVLVGAALAAAGATYQNMFRNPLVSPDILGVSAGASLGAVLAIFLSLPVLAIQGMAFVGGLVAVGLIYAIGSAVRGRDPILTLILSGVVIGTLLGSGIALIKYLADPYNQLPAITFWLLGSLASIAPADVKWAALSIAVSLVPLYFLRWRINLLSLSDDEAKALGVNVTQLRIIVVSCATLMTAAAVAIAGVIGWIGLVIPHAARMLVGPEFARLLPVTMLLGATFMLAVDTVARTFANIEIPPGVLTALLGTPFFIWLLWRTARRQS